MAGEGRNIKPGRCELAARFFAGTNHSPRGLGLEGQTLPDRHYDRFLATAGQKSLPTNMARQVVVYVLSFNAATLPFPLFHKLSVRTRRFILLSEYQFN